MDVDALTSFAAEHEAALLRYAFLLTGSRSDAEDLVQTTFVRLLQQRGTTVRAPTAYARRMIYNEFCTRRRRLWRFLRFPCWTPPGIGSPHVFGLPVWCRGSPRRRTATCHPTGPTP
jgi:DNA-directed RNA polymerase specialized sigma24 family protein